MIKNVKREILMKNKNPKGLGDVVENIAEATGIKKIVDKVSEATGEDCGCGKRKDTLNRVFPFDKK